MATRNKARVRKKPAAAIPEELLGEMKKGWPKSHRPRTSPGRKLRKRAKKR